MIIWFRGYSRRNDGGKVKAREIIYIGTLCFLGFLVSEFLVGHMTFSYPLQRFLARVIFQAGFYTGLYLLFALRDAGRRLRLLEALYSREKQVRLRKGRFGSASSRGTALHARFKRR